jgi:hypothetical protein
MADGQINVVWMYVLFLIRIIYMEEIIKIKNISFKSILPILILIFLIPTVSIHSIFGLIGIGAVYIAISNWLYYKKIV